MRTLVESDRFAEDVGQETRPVAKTYYHAELAKQFPPQHRRDRRELLTLCTILDMCAQGKLVLLVS